MFVGRSDDPALYAVDADGGPADMLLKGPLWGVAFSPDGSTIISGSGFDREIRIWRVSDGQQMADFDRECGWGQRPVLPVAVSPDGTRFGYGRTASSFAVAHHPCGALLPARTPYGAL